MSSIWHQIRKPMLGGAAIGAGVGTLAGAAQATDPSRKNKKTPVWKPIVGGAAKGAFIGGALGALRGLAHGGPPGGGGAGGHYRQSTDYGGYSRQRTDYGGYSRRRTGYSRGRQAPPPPPRNPSAIFDKIPGERTRKRFRDLAAMANPANKGTANEQATARRFMEKMMKEHNIKGNVEDFIKNASFIAGVEDAFSNFSPAS